MLSGAALSLLGLLGLGLGVIIRHTAGAIGAYVGGDVSPSAPDASRCPAIRAASPR